MATLLITAGAGLVLIVGALFVWRTLPKDRPNQNWIPTAAEIVGRKTVNSREMPVVRYEPPGREGQAEMPLALPVRADDAGEGAHLLVLLDPLNPIQPFAMDAWYKRFNVTRIATFAMLGVGVVGIVVGVLVYVLQ